MSFHTLKGYSKPLKNSGPYPENMKKADDLKAVETSPFFPSPEIEKFTPAPVEGAILELTENIMTVSKAATKPSEVLSELGKKSGGRPKKTGFTPIGDK